MNQVMEKEDNRISKRTRQARIAAGFKEQTDIAKALGIEYQAYNKYELRSPIRPDLIAPFCKLTNITAEWLLTGEGPMHPAMDSDFLEIMKKIDDQEVQGTILNLVSLLEKQRS